MKRVLTAMLVVLSGCDLVSSSETTEPLSAAAMLDHLEFLAGDSLYGRGSATQRELAAASYLREEFLDYGLEPGMGTAGYLQTFEVGDSLSRNVLAVLPGNGDAAGQWVVAGAHYDHLGFTEFGRDSVVIYNGADDNASGTALLMEIARFLGHYYTSGAGEDEDRRSLLFLAFGSEELGLLGSHHFVENPTVPLDSVVAMVNLDMVGRMRNEMLMVAGSGSSPAWPGLLEEENEQNFTIIFDDSGLQRSDQYPFLASGIPVLFFTTGLHADWHQPTDDVWLIDTANMVRVGEMVSAVLRDLAERSAPPGSAGQ